MQLTCHEYFLQDWLWISRYWALHSWRRKPLSPITVFNSWMLMQHPFKIRHKSGFKINYVFVQFNFSFQLGITKLTIYARPHLVQIKKFTLNFTSSWNTSNHSIAYFFFLQPRVFGWKSETNGLVGNNL